MSTAQRFNPTVELIREVGIERLGNFDGCLCTHFSVQGVDVDVSCRKSSGAFPSKDYYGIVLRVHSAALDVDGAALEEIARDVVAQLDERSGGSPVAVRFCSYEQDSKSLCVYCGNPRAKAFDYLCQKCAESEDQTVKRYDFRRFDFITQDPRP